jgi:LacI family transcriptional regulator
MDDEPPALPDIARPDTARPGLARLVDVARRAGVSTASADRALHRRPGVRPITVQRVLRAAAELDYVPAAELPVAPPLRPQRLTFLLPAGTNQYLLGLGRQIAGAKDQFAAAGVVAQVDYIHSFNPVLLARHLLQHGRSADGIAFMALEHPSVREAVNQLADRGVPTVTLISDIANTQRAAYVGLDNRSAGRTAGYLMARFIRERPAKVAMIADSLSYRAHEEREMGFLHLFQEMAPDIEVVGLREGHDDETKNYRQARMLLAQHPGLAGIYNIGGGAEGIARALKEARRSQSVVFIGHGLTQDTRALLIDGTMDVVITQNPQLAMLDCLAIFANLRAGRPTLHEVKASRSDIIIRENLPM